MKIYIKPKEASEFLGVSVKTLQRWDKEEKFKAFRSPTGRIYGLRKYKKALVDEKL